MAQKYTAYHYDKNTGVFLWAGDDAYENPKRAGDIITPGYATPIAPPAVGEYEAPVWTSTGPPSAVGYWSVSPDYRNVPFYLKANGEKIQLALGQVPDNTMTDLVPPSSLAVWQEGSPTGRARAMGSWVIPLANAKEAKIAEIKLSRWRDTEGGTVEYQGMSFSTSNESRTNLVFTATFIPSGSTTPWETVDGRIFVATLAQLRDIGTLVHEHMEAMFMKQYNLLTQVEAATSIEEIDALSWD